MELKGKSVAVLGAGGSGFAAATLALSHGAAVAAFDSGDPAKLAPAVEKFAAIGVELVVGNAALTATGRYDYTIVSPGIDASWPIAVAFAEAAGEFLGEVEFAYRLSDIPVIAITGTNGKTTTTQLVADMLNGAGLRSVAAGNIGLAYSEVVHSGERYDWVVLEASSFQLETVSTFRPEIAVWTNFAPDHMDRYATLADYRAAKERIFLNRTEGKGSFAISKFEEGFGFEPGVTFSAFGSGGDYCYEDGMIVRSSDREAFDFRAGRLHGLHNAENVMVALAVADHLEIDREAITPTIHAFRAPSHRCEPVGEIDGVLFVNDSKSTNLHSLESALRGQESPCVLVCGGKEKGLDFGELTDAVSEKAKAAIVIGETAPKIAASWSGKLPVHRAADLDEAVAVSRSLAVAGDTVLFSPGTSSFDMFANYGARGDAFREAVKKAAS